MRRWIAAGAALGCFGALVAYGSLRLIWADGPLAHDTDIVVPRGSSSAVGEALAGAGVVRSVTLFRIAAGLTGWQGPLRSAELAFPSHASVAEVLFILRYGRPVQHLLTIAEGLTAARIGELVARARGLTGIIEVPSEGEASPESYAYVLGTPGQAVMTRAVGAMRAAVAQAWAERDSGLPVRSPRELLVLASLVERETHLAAERSLVARVFLNRLRLGMRLQSDPTVAYVESGGTGELPQGLKREALAQPNGYNTYVVSGLPAGPICSPGLASIRAVAHPARSGALYFVADGSGGHAFAEGLAEHVRNVQRYRLLPSNCVY